jgi:hypothetical protein
MRERNCFPNRPVNSVTLRQVSFTIPTIITSREVRSANEIASRLYMSGSKTIAKLTKKKGHFKEVVPSI